VLLHATTARARLSPMSIDDLRVLRDGADTVNEACRICKKPVVHY
jgi:hypothetical protein